MANRNILTNNGTRGPAGPILTKSGTTVRFAIKADRQKVELQMVDTPKDGVSSESRKALKQSVSTTVFECSLR